MSHNNSEAAQRPACRREGATVSCYGSWTLAHLEALERCLTAVDWPEPRVQLQLNGVTALDTAGAWLLQRTIAMLEHERREVVVEGLNERSRPLLAALGDLEQVAREPLVRREPGTLETVGYLAVQQYREYVGFLAFLGALGATVFPLFIKPLRLRWKMLMHFAGVAGYRALPIVGLLAFLLGVVMAYQGGVQLRQYGANIFVADLVGVATVRELGPLLTAIIVAGRTGSAFTAAIGTMKVTEEIDALRSIGIPPLEQVALPRILALIFVLPLLTVYADIMGLLGGIAVSSTVLGVSPASFIERVGEAVSLTSYFIGVGKAPVFAAIIGSVGCYHGFEVVGSAESVGRRTTTSVVQAIFLVIVVDAGFSVVLSHLGL